MGYRYVRMYLHFAIMLYAYVITGGDDYMVESFGVTVSAEEIIVPYNI